MAGQKMANKNQRIRIQAKVMTMRIGQKGCMEKTLGRKNCHDLMAELQARERTS